MLEFSSIKEYRFFCAVFLDEHLTVVVLTVSFLHLITVVLLVMSKFLRLT